MKCCIIQDYRGLHSLLRQIICSSEKEVQIYLEIITYVPSNYAMDHPKFIILYYIFISNQKEESILAYMGLRI